MSRTIKMLFHAYTSQRHLQHEHQIFLNMSEGSSASVKQKYLTFVHCKNITLTCTLYQAPSLDSYQKKCNKYQVFVVKCPYCKFYVFEVNLLAKLLHV